MENKIYLAFVFIFSVVCCNQCGNQDLNGLFDNDSSKCQVVDKWTFNRASVSIDKQNDLSNFLTPSTKLSCITSKTLSLSSFGVLKVKVYTKSIMKEDYLTVLVYEEGSNAMVGQASLSGEDDVNDGWHLLEVKLNGVGRYAGYITLMGKSSSNSNILVTSICYSPGHEHQPPSDDTSTLTSKYQAPDMYDLQIGSVLIYPVHRNEHKENEIDMVDTINKNSNFRIFDMEEFWTPLTISLAVAIPVIILALLSWACFALGKRKGAKQEPQMIYEDVDNLPKPYLVPRVKSVYSESVAGSTYGSRNNNIYSV